MKRERFLIAIFVFCLAGSLAHAQDQRTVLVDGYRIRVQTASMDLHGGSQPAVILESGGGAPLGTWTPVFDKIARFAAVITYDRPGNPNGLSQPDGQLPTPRHVAERLHSLLAELAVRPPYVLVGHSWGGLLIRMFAAVYPNEVAGLVYVDPAAIRTREGDLAYLRAQGYSEEALRDRRAQRRQMAALVPAVKEPDLGEAKVFQDLFDSDFEEFRALPPTPDVPVTLLMSAKFDPRGWAGRPCEPIVCHEQEVRFRTEWLKDFVREVNDSTFTIASGSGHQMHWEDPDLVVSAIQRVVSAAGRTRKP